MTWQTLQLAVERSDAAAAEALLLLAGADAVSLVDAGSTPQLEPAPRETPLWPVVRMRALFAAGIRLAPLVRLLEARFPAAQVAVGSLAEEDWQAALTERFRPRTIGAVELLGADSLASESPESRPVRLHMGFAFGTGEHPTTRLCLEWLDVRRARGRTVLDYGCGSGVLALAALALGATSAAAVDDDEQALIAARANAELNGASSRLWVGAPAELPERQFDVVLANILAGTLVELAPSLAAHTAPGGHIVLSGILAEQIPAVESAYAPHFGAFGVAVADGWVRLDARRASDAG